MCVCGGCIGGKQDDLEKVMRKKLSINPSFLRHSGKEDSEKTFLGDQLVSMGTKAVEGTFRKWLKFQQLLLREDSDLWWALWKGLGR